MSRPLTGSELRGAALLAVLIAAQGCDEPACNTLPRDPELQDRAQLLPESHRVQLSREEVVRACQEWVACAEGDIALDGQSVAVGDDPLRVCILLITLAAAGGEVIIETNEDARFVVDCISSAASDCDQILDCSTANPLYDQCAGVGCPRGEAAVTCNGSVASVETDMGIVERDCARSRRACDPDSVSGCNDARRFSCPTAQIGKRVKRCSLGGGWCEGDVRMGCAAHAKVHDCAVFGGACQEVSEYRAECVYPDAPDPGCESVRSLERGMDADGEFQCVAGRKVHLE